MQAPEPENSFSKSYSLTLLQAISDWQREGTAKQKISKGQRLLELSSELPPYFRTEDRICYRQIALKKGNIWRLADQLMLGETISSWAVDLAVAKEFKGGVAARESEFKAFIFAYKPIPGSVVINLDKLLRDDAFLKACADNKENISWYSTGLGQYQNTQQEVVINLSQLPIDSVFAIGGHGSTKEILLTQFMTALGLTREPTETDRIEFDKLLISTKAKLGPGWVAGPAKYRVLEKLLIDLEWLKPLHIPDSISSGK